jgi:hypothetical protein
LPLGEEASVVIYYAILSLEETTMKNFRWMSYRPCLEELETRLTPSGNPGVLPPDSHPFDASYGQWAARWWKWAYSIPVSVNPLFDETGAQIATGQSGKVWFLAGVINVSGTAERTGTIPAGKALFFPILNYEADNLCPPIVPPLDPAGLRALAKSNIAPINPATGLEADVDGRPIRDLKDFHEKSPVFSVTFPDNNVFQFFGCNVPAGTYTPFVDEGYYVMLKPLSVGQHTIHFHGDIPAPVNFSLDITYHITVVGEADHGDGEGEARDLTASPSNDSSGSNRGRQNGPAITWTQAQGQSVALALASSSSTDLSKAVWDRGVIAFVNSETSELLGDPLPAPW